MSTYSFRHIENCCMCLDSTSGHKLLGQRLNQTQGKNPRNKVGVSVSIQQCKNCGLIYSNPQPIPSSIQDHYGTPPEEYWKESYFNWTPGYFKGQIDKAIQLLGKDNGFKALDIGAGLGKAMLSMESRGIEAYGLEPSIPFYNRAIEKMGIKKERLKQASIEESEYPDECFDFITFGVVLEHLYEPAESLERALKWLKPGGIIHIDVPSSRWLLSKIFNFYYRLAGTNFVTNLSPMHSPYHMHEFDIKSFEALGRRLGYTIDFHRYEVCNVYHLPKVFHGMLKKYMHKTNTGMNITLYIRKR